MNWSRAWTAYLLFAACWCIAGAIAFPLFGHQAFFALPPPWVVLLFGLYALGKALAEISDARERKRERQLPPVPQLPPPSAAFIFRQPR